MYHKLYFEKGMFLLVQAVIYMQELYSSQVHMIETLTTTLIETSKKGTLFKC